MPFTYPTNVELSTIEQDLLTRGRAGRVGLDLFPTRPVNASKVRWTQRDNYGGLQNLRGLDGRPTRVQRVGRRTYEYEPGVFGEFVDWTETELTTRAGDGVDIGTTNVDIGDLMVEADDLLIGRELDRQELMVWTLVTTGTIVIPLSGPQGLEIGYKDTYPIQTYTAGVPWGTLATATPITDFQTIQQLQIGHGVDFSSGSTAYMNSATANLLLNNRNANDLNGRRLGTGATINTLNDVSQFLLGQNLPRIQVYDGGYIQEGSVTTANPTGTFIKFIPNNKVALIGRRTSGAKLGEYLMTRNMVNGGRPGSYSVTIDRINGVNAEKRIPPNIERHRGHNGGLVIYFPSAIVLMNV